MEGFGKLFLAFALHEQVLELRHGRVFVVGHRKRKAGCEMARRGRGRLLEGPAFWRVLEHVGVSESTSE